MASSTLNIGSVIFDTDDRNSSDLEALINSHLWKFVTPHLTFASEVNLNNALHCGRDLTNEEIMYLKEGDDEDYYSDGYDKWDELYNEDDDNWCDDNWCEYQSDYDSNLRV